MKDHSIYCALYNANAMGFPWHETLDNWTRFLNGEGQISIAVNTSTDDTLAAVTEYTRELAAKPGNGVEYTITATDIPLSNPLFDGMIKNEALRKCNREYCTLLDIDEVLPLSNRAQWETAKQTLNQWGYDALFVNVIDLFHDEHHYRSLGKKWYLHRNKPFIKRGRVAFAARPDGTTDIQRSDTCELIDTYGGFLIPTASLVDSEPLGHSPNPAYPYVVHLGWLYREQRLRQSAFWAPVWSARDGTKVEKPLTNEDLDKIPYHPHNLKHWNEE